MIILLILLLFPSICQANTRDGLVGWWKLNETSGTSYFDSSRNGKSGTGVNTPLFEPNCARNNCYRGVTANSTYIKMGNNFNFERTDPFSISFWAKQDSLSSQVVVAKITVPTISRGYFISSGSTVSASDGSLRFVIRNTTSTNAIDVASASSGYFQTTKMNHFVITYSGSSTAAGVTMYYNGVSISKATPVSDNLTSTVIVSSEFNIGSRDNGTDSIWGGTIDDVRVYNRVLTAQEVKNLYNAEAMLNYAPSTI